MISLYAILDPETASKDLVTLAKAYERGGVTMLQYRAKNTPINEMIKQARAIKAAVSLPLLINDRVDIALAAGADGVHLGQSDMNAVDARRLLGGKAIIGLTLKNERHIMDAPLEMLSYGCIGGVFATSSKKNADAPLGVHELKRLVTLWKARSTLPIGAIAGINAKNAAEVLATGVDGLAVISALSMAIDPEKAARVLREIRESSRQ
jgi:thiamine-phosphate pyrophosphorylase